MTSLIKQIFEYISNPIALSANRAGELKYVKIGDVVIVSGFVTLTGNLTNGAVIATGLPLAYSQLALIPTINSTAGTSGAAFVNTSNNLCVSGTWTSGTHRINGAYIAS